MGLAPAFLTFNPGTLGRASVAFSTHDLTSVDAHPHESTYSTIAAQMNSFVTSPPILTQLARPLAGLCLWTYQKSLRMPKDGSNQPCIAAV